MNRLIKIIAILFIIVSFVCVFLLILPQAEKTPDPSTTTVYFFYGEECSHCHTIMPFIMSLKQKYPDVDLQVLETWHNQTNQELYVSLNRGLGLKNIGVPEVIIGTIVLVGDREISDKLESVILENYYDDRRY